MSGESENLDKSFLQRMTALYADLNNMWSRHGEMPDEVCDAITDAAGLLCDAIIDAPAKTEDDVASKLRFAAHLVSNKGGIYHAERPAVERALSDLMALREVQWHADALMLQKCQAASTAH